MTSLWLPNYTGSTKIGKYQGHEVVLSDLSPLVTEIQYFPIKSSKVNMPIAIGVKMLYDLFMKDIWGLFEKHTQYNAFGYFAVRLAPGFLSSVEKLSWNGYFWTQQVQRLKAEGKLSN